MSAWRDDAEHILHMNCSFPVCAGWHCQHTPNPIRTKLESEMCNLWNSSLAFPRLWTWAERLCRQGLSRGLLFFFMKGYFIPLEQQQRTAFGKRSVLCVTVLDSNLPGLLKEVGGGVTKWELLVILLENFYIRLVCNFTAFRSCLSWKRTQPYFPILPQLWCKLLMSTEKNIPNNEIKAIFNFVWQNKVGNISIWYEHQVRNPCLLIQNISVFSVCDMPTLK